MSYAKFFNSNHDCHGVGHWSHSWQCGSIIFPPHAPYAMALLESRRHGLLQWNAHNRRRIARCYGAVHQAPSLKSLRPGLHYIYTLQVKLSLRILRSGCSRGWFRLRLRKAGHSLSRHPQQQPSWCRLAKCCRGSPAVPRSL